MYTGYILYNSNAGTARDVEDIDLLEVVIDYDVKFVDVTSITDYRAFISSLHPTDFIIIAGGDGTLNRFVNNTADIEISNEILYYPNGTGNDFARDLGHDKGCTPFEVTEYLKSLPAVEVNGKRYRFVNGIGFGIDGYCCEVGDELKKAGKKVNYTAIAVKGLLFHYRRRNAKLTVDDRTYTFKKVWMAPTMIGRYYGGGMMPTPAQNRIGNDGTLSTLILHGSGKLKTLITFPSIFKGEHIRHRRMAKIYTGHRITIEFDRPTALQIDGETIKGVTSYTAISPAAIKNEADKGEQ